MTFPSLHEAVNNQIDAKVIKCSYASFNDAVALTIKHGVGTLFVKMGLVDAFKHILVILQDWPVLGLSQDLQLPDSIVVYQYCVDFFLPIGLHRSPAFFSDYAMPFSMSCI